MFAIVGIAAQLPSGQFATVDLGYEEFWEFLVGGEHAFEDLDKLELEPNPFATVDVSSMPRKGAFLKSMTEFDHSSFGISSDDARVMPNSARRLMELSFRALLDAGIQTRRQPIGCFMSGNNDLGLDNMDTDGSLVYVPSAIPNRISYALNLTGPSLAIDTACSSSLTALHLATSAIKNGDCTAALVGAAQSNRSVVEWWRYGRAHLLSPDGICKPFDERADGFARGEGAIVIVVKSLQNALDDKDHIYCTIAASSHAATGSDFPVYVPNGSSQQHVISQVYEKAGRKPTEADYVELHMTGTRIGDPIEANATGQVFRRDESSIRVGSVKANVGCVVHGVYGYRGLKDFDSHLEGAAFLASLVKACHIFDKGIIPPTPNFSVPNGAIHWDKYGIEVVTKPVALGCKTEGGRPLISIASAGIGGSHGHVLLEGPPPKATSPPLRHETSALFLIGGLTPSAIQAIARDISHLPNEPEVILENAVLASRQARQLPWRSFLIYKNNSISLADLPRPVLVPAKAPKLAYVFSGQGPQNAQMGHQLFQQYPVFRDTVIELDETHQKVMGYSLLESTGLFSREITDPRVLQRKWPVIITLPALVMIHIGVFELLKSMGILPDYMLGHSAGETAIVYASGAGSKAMAMEIALARGRSMTCTEAIVAGMAVVSCDASSCQRLMNKVDRSIAEGHDVEISCFNAADSVVVSGKKELVDAVVSLAKEQGIFAQVVNTMVPGHCKYIEHCREEHDELMKDIFARYQGPHIPVIPVFSTCRPGETVQEFTPEYFWDNARNPVCFSEAVFQTLARSDSSSTAFIEVSPHPVLSGTVVSHGVPSARTICPMRRLPRDAYDPHHETTCFLTSVAQLALIGYDRIDLSGLYGIPENRKPRFNHPMQRSRVLPFKTFATASSKPANPLLSSLPSLGSDTFELFSQHRVGDIPVVPGTGWIEMVLEAGGRCLWDVEFHSLCSLQQGHALALSFEREGRNKWSISSSQNVETHHALSRTIIATGCLGTNVTCRHHMESLDIVALQERLGSIALEGLHSIFGDHHHYGPSFTRMISLHGNPSEMLAEIRGLDEEEHSAGYILHPGVLDACFRVVAYRELLQVWDTSIWLPKHIRKLVLYGESTSSSSLFAYVRLNRWEPGSRSFNITITNDRGQMICELTDLKLQRAQSGMISKPIGALKLVSEPLSVPDIVPLAPALSQHQGQDDYMRLFHVLDRLVLDQLRKSFKLLLYRKKSINQSPYLKRMADLIRVSEAPGSLDELEIQEQRTKWPAYFEITRRFGEVHEDVLLSSQGAVNVLFTDDLMGRYYAEHNLLMGACERTSQQLDNILRALRESGRYTVKILEIGAGTGTLTRQLIPIIKDHPQLLIEYTVTDTSYPLVADLAQSLELDRLIPKAYDPTKDPYSQGFSPESFDIIIAYHALHIAPELKVLTGWLHDLLVPGGLLLAAAIDTSLWSNKPGAAWVDFTFGSFAEWSSYQDGCGHCSMSTSQWEALLHSSGFGNMFPISGSNCSLDFIFTCQKKSESIRRTVEPLPAITLYHYKDGEETQLQQCFRDFGRSEHDVMCLWTDRKYDSDSAMGLVMTLAREFTTWTIWLAMFDVKMDLTTVEEVIKVNHIHLARNHLVYFSADGSPSFPRVVRLPSIVEEQTLSTGSDLSANHLIIHVTDYDHDGGFIGNVVKSADSEIPEKSFVVGLSATIRGNTFLTVHGGRVVKVDQPDHCILPYLPAMFLQFQCLGFSCFTHPLRGHPSLRVLIALRSENLTRALCHLLNTSCDINVLTGAPETFVDVLVTDHETLDADPSLEQNVGTNGRMVIWSPQMLERTISQEPWVLRHLFGSGIRNFKFPSLEASRIADPNGNACSLPDELGHTSLFDPHKVYILIGGIGGIGLHLAVWLYQNGARHIYLTSRRGRESVSQAGDILLYYKLQYLESRTDLDLRLVACDTLNVNDTESFFNSVRLSIGGCFLMPLILRDSLFLKQTEESMDIVKRSKAQAFDIVTTYCDVKKMDFFVAFSSVAALWGNPGQSNYASGCAILDGKVSEYSNAFALLVPAVMDAGYLVQPGTLDNLGLQGADEWGVGVEELCEYIRDGIRRVKQGTNPSIYIPDLDVNVLTKYFTLPPLYHFLIPFKDTTRRIAGSEKPENSGRDVQGVIKAVREVIKTSLEIRDEDAFPSDMPFINYGLDSIRATRLSRQLKQYVEISHADLLLGMSWTKLEERIQSSHSTKSKSLNVVETCKRLVLSTLGINSSDAFSEDMPFVSYGLDSIRATQLSRKLKPYIKISHMDLLLGMSWADFEKRINQSNSSEDQQRNSTLQRNIIEECKGLVVESLGIDTAAFDPDIPFINYGLDSIRATRLARQLQPYVKISQMDLLLGMAWRGLEAEILSKIFPEGPAEKSAQVVEKSKEMSVSFTKLNEATEDGPIILALPGATGTLTTISPMMNHATKGSVTIWAVHFDLSAYGDFPPPLQELGDKILGGIKERYPHGALRIVTISGSSTLAILLAKALEAEGRQVLEISFLDHFPALFCHDAYGLVPYIASREGEPEAFKSLDAIVERGTEIMLRLQELDPTMQGITSKWEEHDTAKGAEAIRGLETARMLNGASVAFIKNLYYQSRNGSETYDETLVRWLGSVSAPLLVVVADKGFSQVVEMPWADMGAGKVLEHKKNVQILHVDAAHFEVVGCETIARRLCL